MAINGELILGRDSGLFEMDDAEILGFIKKVRVSFSYSPPEDGGRWEPSFDASISISTIEVVRVEKTDYTADGDYRPHDEVKLVDITDALSRADIEDLAGWILEEIEDQADDNRRPAYRPPAIDYGAMAAIAARGVTGYASL